MKTWIWKLGGFISSWVGTEELDDDDNDDDANLSHTNSSGDEPDPDVVV